MVQEIKTIQSSNKEDFDKQINEYLSQGWLLLQGSYSVLDGNIMSQSLVKEKSITKPKEETSQNSDNQFQEKPVTESYLDDDGIEIKEVGIRIDGKMHGEWISYRLGTISTKINYKNDEYHGEFKIYENGRISSITNYKNGIQDGKQTFFESNGKKMSETIYVDGEQNGEDILFDDDGNKL